MPYRWKKKIDVDEAIVVIMNSLDKSGSLPNWLVSTVKGAIADSDPAMARYFFEQVKKHVPKAFHHFEEDSTKI
ncbi:MAG: hypothetical protein QHG99_03275 [Methanomicrobiales archaeon]|nr:hypothetical protein [Methanomicrobiales archaeon]